MRQRHLKYERANVNAPNVASTARKDLSHLTCFNSDKVSRAKEGQRHLRRLVTVLALCVDETNVDDAPEATLERVPCI